MKLNEFDYQLPEGLIAQEPIKPRDHSRLLILEKQTGRIRYRKFYEIIDYLNSNDVLVFNDTKVIPARLLGKKENGGKQEILLISPFNDKPQIQTWPSQWLVIAKPLPKINQEIAFENGNPTGKLVEARPLPAGRGRASTKTFANDLMLRGRVIQIFKEKPVIEFNQQGETLKEKIYKIGKMPLPPYIKNPTKRSFKNYQTVYAEKLGSVAAPTAGFHFTKSLIKKLKAKGAQMEFITLHVGLGTFEPIRAENIKDHQMHSEYFAISKQTARNLNKAKKQGKSIIAVGSTAARALEFSANEKGLIRAQNGWNNLFIIPGYKFKFVDKLITNFHLPKSTLLMLVSAFADKELIFQAYRQAIQKEFRFYSFGDAMFVV